MFWAALALATALTALVYRTGLHGAFLFDDFANLPVLGSFGPVDNWTTFWRYITSGFADPTGRPLALLTFLIDARNWPADPYPFKRTSLILHLVNGVLLALALRRLGRSLRDVSPLQRDVAAVLGAALWLLHPLFVSTTLYVVQREAMLPATFVLLGLLGWCAGREKAAKGHGSGVWVCAVSIAVCTAMALLSKANGALLPLLCWLVDAIVLAPAQPIANARLRQSFAWMRRVVLILPGIMVIGYLIQQGIHFAIIGVPSFRPWTLAERLLTQARIVCEYLGLLWLPHPYTAGLFNDSVAISTGWLMPPSTLAAVVFLAFVFTTAIALRKRAPALALAILFYFAGQLLESSVIPLELYYEHRNYLPALLMFWPLALWLAGNGFLVRARRILMILIPVLLAGMTYARADLWGDAQQQAEMWVQKNPASPRAQAYAAQAERSREQPLLAIVRLRNVPVVAGEDLQIALNLVGAECDLGQVAAADVARTDAAFRNARMIGQLGYTWFMDAIGRIAADKTCTGLDARTVTQLLDAAAANPYAQDSAGRRQDNLSLRGSLAIATRDPAAALAYFKQALDAKPDPKVALNQAAQLGAAGYPAQGLAELDYLEKVWKADPASAGWSMAGLHAWLLQREDYWRNEITHLRQTLQTDVAAQSAHDGQSRP